MRAPHKDSVRKRGDVELLQTVDQMQQACGWQPLDETQIE